MPNADLLDLALGRDSLCTQIMLALVNLAMIRIGDLCLCMCGIRIVYDGLDGLSLALMEVAMRISSLHLLLSWFRETEVLQDHLEVGLFP